MPHLWQMVNTGGCGHERREDREMLAQTIEFCRRILFWDRWSPLSRPTTYEGRLQFSNRDLNQLFWIIKVR